MGLFGARGYLDNFLSYRGFAPPREPAFVTRPGTVQRLSVPSPALGGRAQEAYVYLPSGYAQHPKRRYSVLYLLHGFPGRPLAFLQTVQMGIVDDALTTAHRAQPLILVMPFGSTGTFDDQEWVNGIGADNGWSTFVSRDVVHYVDTHYRTIATARGRGIAGLSEGGYGAINIAVHHPQEFGVVESWSGYDAAGQAALDLRAEAAAPVARTIRGSSCGARRRTCARSGRTSGSTRARPTGSACRTPRSRTSSRRCTSSTSTASSTAGTTGRSGGTTRASRISRRPEGSRMARVARSIVAVVLSLGVLVAATGLALSRAACGARSAVSAVRDALALDELSKHGGVSIVLFLAVWGVAAALLGLVARWARAERLTAGLLLALGTGAWLYVLNGVSILVVRQISAHEAFRAAAAEQAVVIPAALAGLGGALLGRTKSQSEPRARIVLAWLVAGVALLAAFDAMFPEHRRSLITALDPAHVHGLTKALVAPLAAGLVVAARGLARGNRRAWQVAVCLMTALLVLHIERRFDEGAIVTGIAVVALVARRGDFGRRGDPGVEAAHLRPCRARGARVVVYGLVDALGESHDGR